MINTAIDKEAVASQGFANDLVRPAVMIRVAVQPKQKTNTRPSVRHLLIFDAILKLLCRNLGNNRLNRESISFSFRLMKEIF